MPPLSKLHHMSFFSTIEFSASSSTTRELFSYGHSQPTNCLISNTPRVAAHCDTNLHVPGYNGLPKGWWMRVTGIRAVTDAGTGSSLRRGAHNAAARCRHRTTDRPTGARRVLSSHRSMPARDHGTVAVVGGTAPRNGVSRRERRTVSMVDRR